jgi:zinc protease
MAGVAHFISRTLDRGTTTRSAAVIAEELESRAVSLNMTVNRHVVSLIGTCLVEDLRPVLDIIADVVMDPTCPDEEVAIKRGEIVTMIRQDEDSPAAVATEGLLADLYGSTHGYGRRPRGSVGTVELIDRTVLRRFHKARFSPHALSLVMVGDVEPALAIDAAREAFGPWAAPPPAALELAPVTAAVTRRMRAIPMMNKAQTDIAYGFTSITRSDPTYYAYWLMNNILGQYALGGRLGDSIRERQGMAYYVFSSFDANVIPGPFLIRAGVSPANVDRAVASIDRELDMLAAEGPRETEIAESRQYLIWSMPRTLETNIGIAHFLQTEEFFGLGLDYDLRVPALLQAVTRDDVHEAARRTLVSANATVVIAGPYTGAVG